MASKRIKWRNFIPKLEQLNTQIYNGTIRSVPLLFSHLDSVFGKGEKVRGTDNRILAFIEFAFSKAEGPYSELFQHQVEVIKTVIDFHPALRYLLNASADHALANMVLSGRGNLKFKICDRYELIKVLKAWKYLNLRRRSSRSVFNAILEKPTIQQRLQRPDYLLMARLESIFPQWKREINPQDLNIQEALYNLHRSRFDIIIQERLGEGMTLNQLIERENERPLPVGLKRNNFLAYLIKKKHNFTCQLQRRFSCDSRSRYDRWGQCHHIIPLSQGGEDYSANLIVLCSYHHGLVHRQDMEIDLIGNPIRVQVRYRTRYFELQPN